MRRRFLLGGAAWLLAGCIAQPRRLEPPADWPPSRFAFNGRLAVRHGTERHNLRIDWRHAPDRDEILLATPLGQGLAEISRDAAGARLQLADRRSFVADDWSGLAEQAFGFRLPLAAAPRWLLGNALDAADTEGWRIRVLERESDDATALPVLIELERDDIAVRLKIDEWSELQ